MTNILLVDDRENLLALEAVLEPLEQKLLYAHSDEEALRQLLQHDVAVILLDVQMPLLDGFETAELIKQRERTRHIPIIFVTAISKEEEHVFRGYSAAGSRHDRRNRGHRLGPLHLPRARPACSREDLGRGQRRARFGLPRGDSGGSRALDRAKPTQKG